MNQIQRRKPTGGWNLVSIEEEYTRYIKGPFMALSSVVNVYDEHLPPHLEWLISFSKINSHVAPNNNEIAHLLKDFGAEDFLEDNHEPGRSRKFWLAVEEKYRVPCPCKDEKTIVEGDYEYSVKKDSEK